METIAVDDLDRQLVQCLAADGRASFSAIAEVLGVSDQTVARRYRRLRSGGLLRVVGLRYPRPNGSANWFLRLRCVPGSGEAIAAALARRSDTTWVQLLSGDTEVQCSLPSDGAGAPEALLTQLPRSGRIVAVTAYALLHMFTGGPDWLGFMDTLPAERVAPLHLAAGGGSPGAGSPEAGSSAETEASDLDTALFAALAVDGRTPYAELAAAAGWSETRVRRRLDQLREARALYYNLEVDTPAFGFLAMAWLWLSVPLAHLADVGAGLARFPEASYVTATTGPANLAAAVICPDQQALYKFLTTKVGALPYVERVETAPVIRTLKQASPVMALRS